MDSREKIRRIMLFHKVKTRHRWSNADLSGASAMAPEEINKKVGLPPEHGFGRQLKRMASVNASVRGVRGIALGSIDGEWKILPLRDFLIAKKWGRRVKVFEVANTLEELLRRLEWVHKFLRRVKIVV